MPFVIYVLGLAVFAQGTSEFMLSGLLPDIADSLNVSVATAGSLTSAFAIGIAVGAPLVALLGRRWPRRVALPAFLVTFELMHVLGATTSSFPVLLITRLIAALANAGFIAVALTTVTAMVDENSKGRATSVLLSGVTVSLIAGVPLGALIGAHWGWRAVFWTVAAISIPPTIAILRAVPADTTQPSERSTRHELHALTRPGPVVLLLLGALVNGATFCTLTYLAPVITDLTALSASWIPAALVAFGIGAFTGVTIAGRLADTRPTQLLAGGTTVLAVGWLLFAMNPTDPTTTFVFVFIQGVFSFAVGSTLLSQVLYKAADAPTLAGGFSVAALNVGTVIGPILGGLTLNTALGYRAPILVSAALTCTALLLGTATLARKPIHTLITGGPTAEEARGGPSPTSRRSSERH
ncbi:MFS transporter [Actinomadura meridiana]|uniref:MFS transporter n=1 Tax=Actinomadura meridiana TaxID=559626 RepID=A0ABP8BZQ9_9ACTN